MAGTAVYREKYIDIMKGIGIICVVLGHTSIELSGWIYSFHMGLFFWITGYLLSSKPLPPFFAFLKKKGKEILFPYAVFFFLSALIGIWKARPAHGFASVLISQIRALILGGGI